MKTGLLAEKESNPDLFWITGIFALTGVSFLDTF
jgi:hypothetical protein